MKPTRHALAVAAALALPAAVHAFDIALPADSDLKLRLDLTPKYSAGYRLNDPSAALTRFDVAVDPGGQFKYIGPTAVTIGVFGGIGLDRLLRG